MKKLSFLLFTTTIVAAVSCSKSESQTQADPTPSTSTEKTIEFVLPVASDNHTAFFEQQFEFDLNGTKVTFKESDMTEMTAKSDLARIPTLIKKTEEAFNFFFGTNHTMTAQYYKYTLGKLKNGETVSAVSRKPIIKSERPSVEEFNCFLGYDLLIDGKEDAVTDVSYRVGVPNTEESITSFFSILDKDFKSISYTYK